MLYHSISAMLYLDVSVIYAYEDSEAVVVKELLSPEVAKEITARARAA